MRDWNHDGKIDRRDRALTYGMMNKSRQTGAGNQGSTGGGNSNKNCLTWFILALIIVICALLNVR